MSALVLVTCACNEEHKKKLSVAPDITLSALKDLVKDTKWKCLPQSVNLIKQEGDDWKELKDGPLNLGEKSLIRIATVGVID